MSDVFSSCHQVLSWILLSLPSYYLTGELIEFSTFITLPMMGDGS